jgi:hypothetical protein
MFGDVSDDDVVKLVTIRLKAKRPDIISRSCPFESLLYKKATTIEEYGGMDPLEGRVAALEWAFAIREQCKRKIRLAAWSHQEQVEVAER